MKVTRRQPRPCEPKKVVVEQPKVVEQPVVKPKKVDKK